MHRTLTLRQVSGIINATWARHDEAIDEALAEAEQLQQGHLREIQTILLQQQRANSDWLKRDLRAGLGLPDGKTTIELEEGKG